MTNPEEQSVPEEILMDWWDSSNYRVVKTSNRTTDSKRILTDAYLRELSRYLGMIHNKFGQLYAPTSQTADFAMEIEFKITNDGKLSIRQARPWVR